MYEPFYYFDKQDGEFTYFEKSLKRNKLIVEEILRNWEKSRNSDLLLFFEYLRTKYPDIQVTSSELNIIFKFPKHLFPELFFESPENTGRIRRKFNEKGKYLPTDPRVIIKRLKKEKYLRTLMPYLKV